MKLAKSLLLGAAAGLSTVAVASAADLPSRKSAPVEYVKICNAYGAGFFYIPGTDTCLKVGGLVLAESRAVWPTSTTFASKIANSEGSFGATSIKPSNNKFNRDRYGSSALGRLELDARTQTGYGTLRAFARIDAYYGTAWTAATGNLGAAGPASVTSATAARETTMLNKAFIQFAGITAGRAQSMFDFYADAYNWELVRGSNSTTNLLAYTATFGGGFSATLSVEDETARRSLVGGLGLTSSTATSWTNVYDVGGTRMPDIVANLRVDQGWGSAQLSGALHNVRAADTTSSSTGVSNTAEKLGWAVQGGVKINLPMLAAGDALYLQAVYQKGASSYMNGLNIAVIEGVTADKHYGRGLARLPGSPGMTFPDFDCIVIDGSCVQQKGYALTAALQHYWTPTISQSLFGSYMKTEYGAGLLSGLSTDWHEYRVGTNVVWSPVKGFGIGAEVLYANIKQSSPVWNSELARTGTDKEHLVETRIRVQRAF